MRRKKTFWSIIIVIGLLLAGLWLFRSDNGLEPPGYSEVRVERGNLQTVVLTTGPAKPQNRLEIKSPVAGRVEQALASEGDQIVKGQILAWMSSTERAALLDAARARGEAELAYWEQLYKPTPLVAPLDGSIIARKIEPGQTVTASDVLYVMSDRLIIEAQVDETDIGRIALGQDALITLDAYPQNVISGRVDHIAFEARMINNVTTYMVDILPDEVPPFLRSGMTANIKVFSSATNEVLVLPVEAVHLETNQSVVWRANPADKSVPLSKMVATGLSDGKRVEIRSGLNEGDTVLVKAALLPQKRHQTNPFLPFGGRPRR